MFAEAAHYLGVARGIAEFQLAPRTGDVEGAIQRQREERETHFLTLARGVLGQPDHIYRRLFDWAGCSYGDLENEVRGKGAERTLRRLREAGVYVSNHEFRGRKEIVRGGRRFEAKAGAFLNPDGQGAWRSVTSGSGGKRFQVRRKLEMLRHVEGYHTLNVREFDLGNRECVLLASILPSSWPLLQAVRHQREGAPVAKWFAPGITGAKASQYLAATRFICGQSYLLGKGLPFPEMLGADGFARVARYMEQAKRRRPVQLRSSVSFGARVAKAALEAGLDISGTLFQVSGEPLTAAKRQVMESTGSLVVAQYHATELSAIGFGCREMADGNRAHLIDDANLFFTDESAGLGRGRLFATTGATFVPNVLINLEMDDTVTLAPAGCDCAFSRAGFTTEVRDIFSYSKITGQGMMIQSHELLALLEERLPGRFGGIAGDFQLCEEEREGQTQMVLRVSPRTGIVDLQRVNDYFFEQIRMVYGGHLSHRVWSYTGGLSVVREEPVATATGKVHAIRLIGQTVGGNGE